MQKRLSIYFRLFGYLRPYWPQMIAAYGAVLVATLVNLFIPQVIAAAIDNGIATGQPSALFVTGAIILGIAIVRGVAGYLQRFYGEWLTHRVSYDLRGDFFAAIENMPFAFHDRAHTGDLMSRATGDIGETDRFAGFGLMELTSVLALGIGVVVAMFYENARLAMIALGPIITLLILAITFGRVVEPQFKLIQQQLGLLSTTMQESLTGINLVKAFAREPYEFAKFDEQNDEWFRRRSRVIRLWGDFWPSFTLVLATGIFLMLWVGGPWALSGEITVGSLFVMISYLLMLNAPAQQLGNLVNLAANAGASAQRVFEIIDTPNPIVEKPGAIALQHGRGGVHFEQVSFAYAGDARVLHDVDFAVAPGMTVALVGPTGSGKSSVVALLPRFYDVTAGRVLVDGMDVREVTLHSLRQHIGVVQQNPFLFSATLRENIAYGVENAPLEAVIEAAKAANAHDFILRFPQGYDTKVGERGVTLSGGQRQRIAIARTLLYNPRILILDDSTSSVDTETEHLIQQALQTLMQGRTTFIIAQRLVTLKHADLILVLDEGRIVERGVHAQLLARHGLYRNIYDLQLRDQEEFAQLERKLRTGY
ncbi:MAG: ABC transporter ATP-binding protein [Anaerolineales bacterium]|nr:ABC transporter ATP-binding protein [Anaerolineales bacterium]